MISKSSPTFKSSYSLHLSLHLLFIFSSLSFSLLFVYCHVIFFLSLSFFLDSFNCKVPSQLVFKWRAIFKGKILKEFWSRWCLFLCQLKKSYWHIIIFLANKLLVSYHPLQSWGAKVLFSSYQCLLTSDLVLVCECFNLEWNWQNSVKTFNVKPTQKVKFTLQLLSILFRLFNGFFLHYFSSIFRHGS